MIHDSYYLVNLVDNDYVAGNKLFDILDTVLKKLGKIKFVLTPDDETKEGF